MQIEGIVALVSGGASGLGEATVRRLLELGARGVAVADLHADRAQHLVDAYPGRVIAVATDVRDSEQVGAAVQACVDGFGRIDAVVCCAGIGWAQRTLDKEGKPADLSAYQTVIAVNLVGTFDVVRQAAAVMATQQPNADGERGVVVMTASLAAYDGQIGQAAYSASKGGIVGMTLPLARDLAAVGVRVATIAPGLIDTPIYAYLPDPVKDALGALPVFPRRFGRPDEYAHMATAIIENTYLNGEVIRLDAAVRMPPK